MKRLFVHGLVICALVAGMGNACAWEYPIGKKYPEVIAKDGVFVVESRKYMDLIDDQYGREDDPIITTRIFSEDGNFTSETAKKNSEPSYSPEMLYPHLLNIPKEHHGFELTSEDGTVWIVPNCRFRDDATPCVISLREGQYKYHSLDRKEGEEMIVMNTSISENFLYLLIHNPSLKKKDDWKVTLRKFSLDPFSEKASVALPTSFSFVSWKLYSNMLFYGGKVYLALLKERGGGSLGLGFEVILVNWDGVSSKCHERVLTAWADSCSGPFSLANIGDKALMAWLYPSSIPFKAENFVPQAPVRTLAFSLASDANAWCIVHDLFYWLPLLLALVWPVIAVLRGGRVWLYVLISHPLVVASYFSFAFAFGLPWIGFGKVAQEIAALTPAAIFFPLTISLAWVISIPTVIAAWLLRCGARWGKRKFYGC